MDDKTAVVLAMHGMPASDFPKDRLTEWGKLRAAHAVSQKYIELDREIRAWPRTEKNDLYHAASYRIAARMEKLAGSAVFVGFNEFCLPTLDDAFDAAARSGALKVIVITPMMTRGGSHSESDIPQAVERARGRHPGLDIRYVWPFDEGRIAEFLSGELKTAS